MCDRFSYQSVDMAAEGSESKTVYTTWKPSLYVCERTSEGVVALKIPEVGDMVITPPNTGTFLAYNAEEAIRVAEENLPPLKREE